MVRAFETLEPVSLVLPGSYTVTDQDQPVYIRAVKFDEENADWFAVCLSIPENAVAIQVQDLKMDLEGTISSDVTTGLITITPVSHRDYADPGVIVQIDEMPKLEGLDRVVVGDGRVFSETNPAQPESDLIQSLQLLTQPIEQN